MKILSATLKDCAAILALQKLAYQQEAEIYHDFSIPPLHQTIEQIEREFESQIFLKGVEETQIVGSVRAYQIGETCYIGKLIVHPNFQNQGLGRKLMQEIETLFPEAKRYELFTGANSRKNLHLYQKLGYQRFKEEKLSDAVDIVYLEKWI